MPRSLFAVVLSALIAGCSAGDGRTPAPVPAPVAVPPSPSARADDPPGTLTCGKVIRAVREATLMVPGVVAEVAGASATADAPVADAARRLSAAYTAATTARGTDGEPDAVAGVSAAAAEMVDVCADSGLETVG
jgi:hypothetical protein